MTDPEPIDDEEYVVGYKRPPRHTRFQPGVSGYPSGRPRGAQNFKALFQKIMREQISLREGSTTKTISKAEAILRGLAIGAMKGDARSLMTLFKLAEHAGEFEEKAEPINKIERVIISWAGRDDPVDPPPERNVPAISQNNTD
jgi:hypothetical protein